MKRVIGSLGLMLITVFMVPTLALVGELPVVESAGADVLPHSTTPSSPLSLDASVNRAGTTATLTWQPPRSNGGRPIRHYAIFKRVSGHSWPTSPVASTGSLTTTWAATGLDASILYQFKVAAVNSVGMGPFSGVASAWRHGTVDQTFTNANPQWNSMVSMGSISPPGNAMAGYWTIQVGWSDCPNSYGNFAQGPNAGILVAPSAGSVAYGNSNITWDGSVASSGWTTPGTTFFVSSSCGSVTVEIDY